MPTPRKPSAFSSCQVSKVRWQNVDREYAGSDRDQLRTLRFTGFGYVQKSSDPRVAPTCCTRFSKTNEHFCETNDQTNKPERAPLWVFNLFASFSKGKLFVIGFTEAFCVFRFLWLVTCKFSLLVGTCWPAQPAQPARPVSQLAKRFARYLECSCGFADAAN